MPLSLVALIVGERGQLTIEVGLIMGVVEVSPNVFSSFLVKKKWEDSVGTSGHKTLRAPLSLHVMR